MIGIIGFGRFGRLAATRLASDFEVLVACTPNEARAVPETGAIPADLDAVCRQQIVILCVPISAMEQVLAKIGPRLADQTLVVDVCSVKEYPIKWMLNLLPEHARILATHPMFGPDSAAGGIAGQKIVLCPVRIEPDLYRRIRIYLQKSGLEVIETDGSQHDRQIAVSLALTHFIGRALDQLGVGPLPIDTEGYKRLLHILDVVRNDTWQLFRDMHLYNPHAAAWRRDFRKALDQMEDKLAP